MRVASNALETIVLPFLRLACLQNCQMTNEAACRVYCFCLPVPLGSAFATDLGCPRRRLQVAPVKEASVEEHKRVWGTLGASVASVA